MKTLLFIGSQFVPSTLTRVFRKRTTAPRITSIEAFYALPSLNPVEHYFGFPIFNGNLNIVVAPVTNGRPNEQKTEKEIAEIYARISKTRDGVVTDLGKGITIPYVSYVQSNLTDCRAYLETLCRIQAIKQLHNIPLDTPVIDQKQVDILKAAIKAQRTWEQPKASAA